MKRQIINSLLIFPENYGKSATCTLVQLSNQIYDNGQGWCGKRIWPFPKPFLGTPEISKLQKSKSPLDDSSNIQEKWKLLWFTWIKASWFRNTSKTFMIEKQQSSKSAIFHEQGDFKTSGERIPRCQGYWQIFLLSCPYKYSYYLVHMPLQIKRYS